MKELITITGNQIELIGFKNLNETQQQLVKRATSRMTIYYLTDGMAFIRSSVSISGNGLSSSISPPNETDYVLMEVYNLLQQANLHTPRKAINSNISFNNNDFNTPSIFDESDCKAVSWGSANKTFLQKIGLVAGNNIKLEDISDTIPKWKIISQGAGSLIPTKFIEIDKDFNISLKVDITSEPNNRFFSKDIQTGELIVQVFNASDYIPTRINRVVDYEQLNTTNKTIVGVINEINAKQPQPSPNNNQWKEVAITNDFMAINYNLKNNKYYRVFYSLDECTKSTKIGHGTCRIIDFIFKDNDPTNIASENIISGNTFNPANWVFINLIIQVTSRGIFLLNYYPQNHTYGYLWKLQELQE